MGKEIGEVKNLPSTGDIRKLTLEPYSFQLPETGFLRLWQIIGDKKRRIPPILPISKSAWWKGVAEGRYPASVKLAERTTCWRVEDIRKLVEAAGV